MDCCVARRDGIAPGGGGNPFAPLVLRDLDFRDEPTTVLADGAVNNLFGDVWTGFNTASAVLFQVTNGVGLQFTADATNTTWNSATRSAPRITLDLATLLPGFQPWWVLLVEAFYPTMTLPNSGNRSFVGFDGNTVVTPFALTILQGGGRRNTAGTQQSYGTSGSGGADTLQGLTSIQTQIAIRHDGRNGVGMSAAYDAGADEFAPYTAADFTLDMSANANQGSYFHPAASLGIGFVTGSALSANTMICTLARLRISQVA